jgi:hypothetical protein
MLRRAVISLLKSRAADRRLAHVCSPAWKCLLCPIMDIKLESISHIEHNNRHQILWSWLRLPWSEVYLLRCWPIYRCLVLLITWSLFECHGLSCDRLAWVGTSYNSTTAGVISNRTVTCWYLEKPPDSWCYILEDSAVIKGKIMA